MMLFEEFAIGLLSSLPNSRTKGLTAIFIKFKGEYIQWVLDTMDDTDTKPLHERKYRTVSANICPSSSSYWK